MSQYKSNLKTISIKPHPTLLTGEDGPLMFYLDNLDPPEFMHTSALIRMYGGDLKRPDSLTVVLAKPNNPSTCPFLRFDINWLYDTLKKGKLQDLGLYLLPNLPNLPETNNNNEEMINNNEEIINDNQEEVVVEPDNVNDAKVDEKESPEAPNEEETSDDELNTTGTSFTTPRQQNDQSETDEDEESSKSSIASESSSVIVEHCPPPMPKLTPRSVPLTPTREMHSAHVQVDRMMSKTSKTTENSRGRRSIGPKSKCCSVSEDFGGSVKREIPVKKYGSKRTKVETDSDEEPVKKKKSMSFGRKSAEREPRKRYSMQEEQAMFNYIVENNLIPVCTKLEVSKKLLHLLPGRSLPGVAAHTRRLIDRISKITDNPEIIKKFQAVGQALKDKN